MQCFVNKRLFNDIARQNSWQVNWKELLIPSMCEWHFHGFSVPAFPNTAENEFTVREFQLVQKSTEQRKMGFKRH